MQESGEGTVLMSFSKILDPAQTKEVAMIIQGQRMIFNYPLLFDKTSDHTTGGSSGASQPKKLEENDQLRNQLGMAFVRAAKRGDATTLQSLLEQDAPVDFVDPLDHATALHYVAAYDARPAFRVLLKSGKCNFLVRDFQGRLPSEIAREYGRDEAMARLLLIKEVRQAMAQGIDPGSLYTISTRRAAARQVTRSYLPRNDK